MSKRVNNRKGKRPSKMRSNHNHEKQYERNKAVMKIQAMIWGL